MCLNTSTRFEEICKVLRCQAKQRHMGTMESLTLILSNSSVFDLEEVLKTSWGKPKRRLTPNVAHLLIKRKVYSKQNWPSPDDSSWPFIGPDHWFCDLSLFSIPRDLFFPTLAILCDNIYIHMRVSGKHDVFYPVPFSVVSHYPM